ncbi:hypothetical protein MRX96_000456 [Rhipicephalus microplus]
MDSTTLAAKSRPPFRPQGCSDLGALSPVSDCMSFLAQRQWFYRSPRKTHIAINASTADAVEERRRGCLETQDGLENWSTQRLGSIWSRARRSNPTNMRCLLDADRVKLEGEAFARNIFGKKTTTRKTSEVQENDSGNATKTKRKKRRCEIGPATAASIHEEMP